MYIGSICFCLVQSCSRHPLKPLLLNIHIADGARCESVTLALLLVAKSYSHYHLNTVHDVKNLFWMLKHQTSLQRRQTLVALQPGQGVRHNGAEIWERRFSYQPFEENGKLVGMPWGIVIPSRPKCVIPIRWDIQLPTTGFTLEELAPLNSPTHILLNIQEGLCPHRRVA